MSNTYKDVSLFNDVDDVGHKAWNRLNVITNLKEDGRPHDAQSYLSKLSNADKMSIGLLIMAIKKKGLETVKKELNKGEEVV
jgi:hypothetical protein